MKCGKRCFISRRAAKDEIKIINRIKKKHNKGKLLKDAYYCDECMAWHMTSMDKTQCRDFSRYLKNKKNGKRKN